MSPEKVGKREVKVRHTNSGLGCTREVGTAFRYFPPSERQSNAERCESAGLHSSVLLARASLLRRRSIRLF